MDIFKSGRLISVMADPKLSVFQLGRLPGHCRTSEELKYTMTRLALDGVDLFVVEQGCAASVKVMST